MQEFQPNNNLDSLQEQIDSGALYETRELYFASVLYSLGVKLIHIRRSGSIFWFIFSDKEKCENLRQKFLSKELLVDAKSFEEGIRTLKDIVHS